jgi:hypothetical protein
VQPRNPRRDNFCDMFRLLVSLKPMVRASRRKRKEDTTVPDRLTVCPETHFPALRRLLGSSGSGCFDPLSGTETLSVQLLDRPAGRPVGSFGTDCKSVFEQGIPEAAWS